MLLGNSLCAHPGMFRGPVKKKTQRRRMSPLTTMAHPKLGYQSHIRFQQRRAERNVRVRHAARRGGPSTKAGVDLHMKGFSWRSEDDERYDGSVWKERGRASRPMSWSLRRDLCKNMQNSTCMTSILDRPAGEKPEIFYEGPRSRFCFIWWDSSPWKTTIWGICFYIFLYVFSFFLPS